MQEILGQAESIVRLRKRIQKIAHSEARVLILGESGTGKTCIAQAIHAQSIRSTKPFLSVNCAAVPESLMESELFGHERGSFTGATERRQGVFERAKGGTLFLDEIGETPLVMQSKLLRVLQEGVFERIGGKETLIADVRVIAATNRDLRQEVIAKRFRQDLYHRLAVIPIQSPPLRCRMEDVPLLAQSYLSRSVRPGMTFAESGISALLEHNWPGNVRELINVIERIVALNESDVITNESVHYAISLDRETERLEMSTTGYTGLDWAENTLGEGGTVKYVDDATEAHTPAAYVPASLDYYGPSPSSIVPGSPSPVTESPKRRGRKPGSKNKPKDPNAPPKVIDPNAPPKKRGRPFGSKNKPKMVPPFPSRETPTTVAVGSTVRRPDGATGTVVEIDETGNLLVDLVAVGLEVWSSRDLGTIATVSEPACDAEQNR